MFCINMLKIEYKLYSLDEGIGKNNPIEEFRNNI